MFMFCLSNNIQAKLNPRWASNVRTLPVRAYCVFLILNIEAESRSRVELFLHFFPLGDFRRSITRRRAPLIRCIGPVDQTFTICETEHCITSEDFFLVPFLAFPQHKSPGQ